MRSKLVLFVSISLVIAFVGIGGKLLLDRFRDKVVTEKSEKAWDEWVASVEKSKNNITVGTAESKVMVVGNFVFPPMPGWKKALSKAPPASAINLEYTKQIDLDKDVSVTISFDYEPTKKRGEAEY